MALRSYHLDFVVLGLGLCWLVGAPNAVAQVDPASGIDFVTVRAPGNAPWPGGGTPDTNGNRGRGRVDYDYRIGKYEVTTAQWVDFFNAAFDRPTTDRIPFLRPPTFWGASTDTPTTPGGQRWKATPGTEMLPVGNISWRMAAIYCNWLTNGKSLQRGAFLTGAYEVSTFGYAGISFTDQRVRSTGATYFLPTVDEWIKAAHYDPNKFGQDQGGWWLYPHKSDSPIIPGPPPSQGGTGQSNSGDGIPNWLSIPLGAYTNVVSPWGLYDASGGSREWLETYIEDPFGSGLNARLLDGTSRFSGNTNGDSVWSSASEGPDVELFSYGFRIAAVVPTPATGTMIALAMGAFSRQRTRR